MTYGPTSLRRLSEAERSLQMLFREVETGIDRGDLAPYITDVTILCAFRGELEQNEAFASGTSELRWPDSKHNRRPARAVDAAPYPIPRKPSGDWDPVPFWLLRGYVLATAARLGIRIRTISWDLPHYELAD